MKLNLKIGKATSALEIEDNDSSFGDVAKLVAASEGYDLPSVVFIFKGKRYGAADARTRLSDKGVKEGSTMMVIGHAAAAVQQALSDSKDDPTLLGIDAELRRSAQRANTAAAPVKIPTGQYTFRSYKALSTQELPGAFPAPSRALQLLHRLAADPGIVHIMREHQFTVGLLSEMPPTDFMDDTRSVTCLLGLNINKGQEIKLRLRTNDLKGFRKYNKIRETLVHELTHNVWGDHDNNFKELNSQLLRECIRMSQARILSGHPTRSGDVDMQMADTPLDTPPAPQTLGGTSTTLSASAAAAAAAARRFAASSPAPTPSAGPHTQSQDSAGPSSSTAAVAAATVGEVDVTMAYEQSDDEETRKEEELMAEWSAAGRSANSSREALGTVGDQQ